MNYIIFELYSHDSHLTGPKLNSFNTVEYYFEKIFTFISPTRTIQTCLASYSIDQ